MEMYQMVLQFGALAILGWMVWHLLTVTFPAFLKSQKEERHEYLAAAKQERDEFKKIVDELKEASKEERGEFKRIIDGMTHQLEIVATLISACHNRDNP
jgi:F0F1-type ATP synthase membrane subunit b/b'